MIECRDNGESADELGNHPEGEKVFWFGEADGLAGRDFYVVGVHRGHAEAEGFLSEALLNHFVEPDKCTSTDEKNFFCADLNVFLLWVFPAALGGDIADRSFENFQESLLDAFAANVASDGDIVGFSADLINFVDINDADFGTFDIILSGLEEAEDDIFDIFANVASFRKGGGISDGEWHINDLG